MNRQAFYAALRRRGSGVFGTSLSQGQVTGIEGILDEAERRGTPLKWLAYMLATTYHETGARMVPVDESLNYSVQGLIDTFGRHRISVDQARRYGRSGSRKADQQAIANIVYGGKWGRENLGNVAPNDGWRYRGRSLVQTTGRRNYTKFGMQDNPDKAMQIPVSVRMLFDGMEQGIYTGKALGDYADYLNMRKVINGTDKAEKVRDYAVAFESALRLGGYGMTPKPRPATGPEMDLPPFGKPVERDGMVTGGKIIAVIIGLLASAAAAFWDKFSAIFGG